MGRSAGSVEHPIADKDVQPGDFSWAILAARTIHPLKVAIIEAMLWLGQPLSPKEMTEMLPVGEYKLDLVSYHFSSMVRLGVLEKRGARQVRGAVKTYHFITPAFLGADQIAAEI
jgi:hypothetical protein